MRDEERPRFERRFFAPGDVFTTIGQGAIGGKAQGLLRIRSVLDEHFETGEPGIEVGIPRFTVLTTEIFEAFMERNGLHDVAGSGARDDEIAHAFQRANLPAEILGDLRALVEEVRVPLAIRSSSLLEDALLEPFAGVYSTKMVPNNQLSADPRFRTLVEAIKFVYASTYFEHAREYRKVLGRELHDEKMAVMVQEVVGINHGRRFYPHVSGVARSYNFYATKPATPEEGVVSLAFGLGKTVVDGERSWTYSPAHPKAQPPFGSTKVLLSQSQTEFWVVNMEKPAAYDPIRETEYLSRADLADAEEDGTLEHVSSTYDVDSDRITPGTGRPGARILNFAPILQLGAVPLNHRLQSMLSVCRETFAGPVEIEFAVSLNCKDGLSARLGFLQVRPMFVSHDIVDLGQADLRDESLLVASELAMGNGVVESLSDVVYVKRERFESRKARQIAAELDAINRDLLDQDRPYLLIVFGRLGSADPSLGIPVEWVQVSGAKVIVEAHLPEFSVDTSQGSHFFQNITSQRVLYLSTDPTGRHPVRWQCLERQPAVSESGLVRHVRFDVPLTVKVDGRCHRGVVVMGG